MKTQWAFLLLLQLTFAHDLWIERSGEYYILHYGHIYPQKGEEEKISYKPENVLKFECLDNEGKAVRAVVEKDYQVRLKGSCGMVQAEFSSGYWTKTVYGLKNLPKDKVSGAVEGWLSVETVRRVDVWSKALEKPLSDSLELVLLENPAGIKSGSKFTVQAYYKNKPLKDVAVSHNGKVVGNTDENGRINLRLRSPGLQLLSLSIKEKGDGIKADYVVRTFHLVFEVGR
ncbi:MAG: DUF4198 domain-containing protein [Aquificaceae bacterium]|nr:DUF4198 domain-containing protein [Aquificaceae bacterium]